MQKTEESTDKVWDLIKQFMRLLDKYINIQKLLIYLYARNKLLIIWKKGIKEYPKEHKDLQ